MGAGQAKLSYRTAFAELTSKTQPIDANNSQFWDQFWNNGPTHITDLFDLVQASEIRLLREECPGNLATLCYKAVECLSQIAEASFPTTQDQQSAINCVRLLTRVIPFIFEDPEWRPFFWSALPASSDSNVDTAGIPLAQTLISSLCDLLFCPDFTVFSISKPGPENAEDMHTIDSCEYIWEAGVGFAQSHPQNSTHDVNRTEILRLLLVCFSETMYLTQAEARKTTNKWIAFFSGLENRHVLPLFTSLLNVVCAYNPASSSLPYNHLMFADTREPLVETALQLLCVTLEAGTNSKDDSSRPSTSETDVNETNLFLNYMSRIHRAEDFSFILNGITRLLNNPLTQTYLPGSAKRIQMHQELLILFWRICDINRKFMFFVLKSSSVLDVLVPILYHLDKIKNDKSQIGLMHIGVFIILLLSGERNFGVRLNKPFTNRTNFDVAVFTGNHADLLILVIHKIITTGHQYLQPLFDCLVTIVDNISPYVKSLSMLSASKLVHLMEAFSQPWFLFSAPNNYQLVLFLLEIFNNIVQYQFDGNACLVYSLIRKRQVFYQLANLPTSETEIREVLNKHGGLAQRLEMPPDDDEEFGVEDVGALGGQKAEMPSPSIPVIDDVTRSDDAETKNADVVNSEVSEEKTTAPLQASLVGTPTISNMTASQPAVDVETSPSGYDLHSHETPSSPVRVDDNPAGEKIESVSHLDASFGSSANVKPPRVNQVSTTATEQPELHSNQSRHRNTSNNNNNSTAPWRPTALWVSNWHAKLPLQTIMRLLQVLVPQVEKICIDKGLTDEPEILKFLQNGTLVGLLPVPHPILIRRYRSNMGTTVWFRTYIWGVVYLRNSDPPIWFDTNVRLFEIQRA